VREGELPYVDRNAQEEKGKKGLLFLDLFVVYDIEHDTRSSSSRRLLHPLDRLTVTLTSVTTKRLTKLLVVLLDLFTATGKRSVKEEKSEKTRKAHIDSWRQKSFAAASNLP
jgi:hypothetical protein